MKREVIRRNCFWYRPWRDMSATIDECYFCSVGECPCREDCERFITKSEADKIVEQFIEETL